MLVRLCTIAARNYLPRARVLARSFAEHHPESRMVALIIDDVHEEVVGAEEPFDVLRPRDLDLDSEEFHRMAMIYDVVELSTSLKPWLIRYLLDCDPGPVIYLDPDIRIYAPLNEASLLAQRHGIVLTPHVTAPIPRDDKQTDEDTILGAGMYNLGFIAVGPQARPFIDFWMERLHRDCRIDKTNHRFVDQRWVDFVPSLFDCHILRDPSYNVAYWNLDHRALRNERGDYTVEGRPLRFFHFSGFDPDAPGQLSRWQGERPRILLADHPDLAHICDEYAAAVQASIRLSDGRPAYAFAELPNGVPISAELRHLYRERLLKAEQEGSPAPPDPFTIEGAEELVSWASGTAQPGERRLPRYLALLHARRPDLRAAFPDPEGCHHEPYLDWAESEVTAGRLDARLVPTIRQPPPAPDGVTRESELVQLAAARADPLTPSRFGLLSRLIRRLVARLTEHEDAHRATVDVRLARALEGLEARLDEIDRRLGMRAASVEVPPSVPRQLAALEARMVGRIGRLDLRFRVLTDRVVRRIVDLEETVDLSIVLRGPAVEAPLVEAPAAQLQVIDGAPSEVEMKPRVVRA
jgi:hypothetical protein